MKPADEVRRFAHDNHVFPARVRGDKTTSVRAGDIHKALGYSNRLPLVCAALNSNKFEKHYRVKRLSRHGPPESTTTRFEYEV